MSQGTSADMTDLSWKQAQLSLSRGGLGLRSLMLHAPAAYIASVCSSGYGHQSHTHLAHIWVWPPISYPPCPHLGMATNLIPTLPTSGYGHQSHTHLAHIWVRPPISYPPCPHLGMATNLIPTLPTSGYGHQSHTHLAHIWVWPPISYPPCPHLGMATNLIPTLPMLWRYSTHM